MSSLASGLFKSLPKPKYTGEEEELPAHAQPRGPRVVGADQLDETQVVLRVSLYRETAAMKGLITHQIPSQRTGPPPTETVQDGDRGRPKILAMAVPFRKFSSRNIPLTWAARGHHRLRMR